MPPPSAPSTLSLHDALPIYRTGADFFASVQSMVDRLGARPVPVQLPLGQEEHFRGVIDLVEMRALVYQDELGTNYEIEEIRSEEHTSELQSRFELVCRLLLA